MLALEGVADAHIKLGLFPYFERVFVLFVGNFSEKGFVGGRF